MVLGVTCVLLSGCGEDSQSTVDPTGAEVESGRPSSGSSSGDTDSSDIGSSRTDSRDTGSGKTGSGKTGSGKTEAFAATIDGRPIGKYYVDDPSLDGWDTEVFSKAAAAQFKTLTKLLQKPDPIDAAQLVPVVTDDFFCGDLEPANQQEVYGDVVLSVVVAEDPQDVDAEHYGADGLAEALGRLRASFAVEDLQVEIKIFRVTNQDDRITTRQHLSIREPGASAQATWQSEWKVGSSNRPPRLRSIRLLDYQRSELRGEDTSLFADCTEAAIGGNDCFQTQLMYGVFHWLGQIQQSLGMHISGFAGMAIGDVNGDGLDDLYICESGGLPNRLFVQNPDSTVTDRSREAGVDWADLTRSALLVDLDNDGDQDLVLGTRAGLKIMSNDGTGRFDVAATIDSVRMVYALCAADYDQDGDLDFYASRYSANSIETGHAPLPMPYYDANNGAKNFMFRNDGGFRFTDVTAQAGLDANNGRFTFAASWEDYDNDGDQDLYLANDFGRNCLYRNDGGRFMDVAAEAGVEDIASGMSVTWGDYNRDGHMDVYVSNMFSTAGNRITFQDQFKPDFSPFARASLQRLAKGNTLFANRGDGTFTDVSVDSGVTMGRWAWSSLFADLNNNGWEDLLVTNGYLSAPDTDDL